MSALGFLLNLITDSDDFDGEIFDDSSEISDDSSNISDDSSETADSSPETSEVPPNTPNDESATDNTSLNADNSSNVPDESSKLSENTTATNNTSPNADYMSNAPDEPSKTLDDMSETTDDSSEATDESYETQDASYHETNININFNRRSRLPKRSWIYIAIGILGVIIILSIIGSLVDDNFVPDSNWRDKVTRSDTEHCVNDIIKPMFDYDLTIKSTDSFRDTYADIFIGRAGEIMNAIWEKDKDATAIDISVLLMKATESKEDEIYTRSKGKYKCNKVGTYIINGTNQTLADVFNQLINNSTSVKKLKTDSENAAAALAIIAYFTMLNNAYWEYTEQFSDNSVNPTQIDTTSPHNSLDVNAFAATAPSAIPSKPSTSPNPTPSPAPTPSPVDPLDTQAKSIASQIAQNVMYEIRLEEGKSVGQFFSIKKALKPCKKKPASCEEIIEPLVEESFVKYKRGIAATILLLNNNKFDKQLFNKIDTELKRNYDSFSKMKAIANNSPVGREIMNATFIDNDTKKQIFYIWYLRQYPYAGEDIWNNQYSPRYDWKEYLNMADNYID